MNTFLDFTVVFLIAALLLAPSLWGVVRDRRIDRTLRAGQRLAPMISDMGSTVTAVQYRASACQGFIGQAAAGPAGR
ncbi:hypothetical protein [Streptomyces sp. ISL-86]|uniref:hypothetical protein n=1 Tax=Streptomyces sp. ISL-86 TaxID=2819187 RepID=UPI001BEA06C6|nr:hypothetical protein [Streptomyces sp. ISL-86]MBT2453747.1 hypothetical protein [Streptomyces sp. ISL-86]